MTHQKHPDIGLKRCVQAPSTVRLPAWKRSFWTDEHLALNYLMVPKQPNFEGSLNLRDIEMGLQASFERAVEYPNCSRVILEYSSFDQFDHFGPFWAPRWVLKQCAVLGHPSP